MWAENFCHLDCLSSAPLMYPQTGGTRTTSGTKNTKGEMFRWAWASDLKHKHPMKEALPLLSSQFCENCFYFRWALGFLKSSVTTSPPQKVSLFPVIFTLITTSPPLVFIWAKMLEGSAVDWFLLKSVTLKYCKANEHLILGSIFQLERNHQQD